MATVRCAVFVGALVLLVGSAAAGARPANKGTKGGWTKQTLVTIAARTPGSIGEGVDLGGAGDTPGDMFVFDQPLLDENRNEIGNNSGYCIRTLPGKFQECQWTLTFGQGVDDTITVVGREADQGSSYIPIVGGTGKYERASGVLKTTPNNDNTFTQVLTIYLPKT